MDPNNPRIQRLNRLAGEVRKRKRFSVRAVNMADLNNEISRVWVLQNRALEHLEGFAPYSREAIETMLLPLKDLADPDLVLFAEADGQTVGWFPAVRNFNEILIHLNGLRYPWDYLRALRYKNLQPKCLSIKSPAVLPEYWDTGVAILLFSEMAAGHPVGTDLTSMMTNRRSDKVGFYPVKDDRRANTLAAILSIPRDGGRPSHPIFQQGSAGSSPASGTAGRELGRMDSLAHYTSS